MACGICSSGATWSTTPSLMAAWGIPKTTHLFSASARVRSRADHGGNLLERGAGLLDGSGLLARAGGKGLAGGGDLARGGGGLRGALVEVGGEVAERAVGGTDGPPAQESGHGQSRSERDQNGFAVMHDGKFSGLRQLHGQAFVVVEAGVPRLHGILEGGKERLREELPGFLRLALARQLQVRGADTGEVGAGPFGFLKQPALLAVESERLILLEPLIYPGPVLRDALLQGLALRLGLRVRKQQGGEDCCLASLRYTPTG